MWAVIETENDVQVVPYSDSKPHDLSIDCQCHPSIDESGAIVHNSFDERELTECLPRS